MIQIILIQLSDHQEIVKLAKKSNIVNWLNIDKY